MLNCFSFLRTKSTNTESLIKEAEVKKNELMDDVQFKREAERIAEMQKKILEENPEFQTDLQKVLQSQNIDSSALTNLLLKQKQLIAENPRLRQAMENQERILNNNPELRAKILQLGKLKKEVLPA